MITVKGKKLAFVHAYVNDIKRNQTAAAIAAGYSEKTAAQIASRLMKDEEVAAAIAELENELHEQNTAKANEVMEFLTSMIRDDEIDSRDRVKAAALLGKHYGLFAEKTSSDTEECGIILMPEVVEA